MIVLLVELMYERMRLPNPDQNIFILYPGFLRSGAVGEMVCDHSPWRLFHPSLISVAALFCMIHPVGVAIVSPRLDRQANGQVRRLDRIRLDKKIHRSTPTPHDTGPPKNRVRSQNVPFRRAKAISSKPFCWVVERSNKGREGWTRTCANGELHIQTTIG